MSLYNPELSGSYLHFDMKEACATVHEGRSFSEELSHRKYGPEVRELGTAPQSEREWEIARAYFVAGARYGKDKTANAVADALGKGLCIVLPGASDAVRIAWRVLRSFLPLDVLQPRADNMLARYFPMECRDAR